MVCKDKKTANNENIVHSYLLIVAGSVLFALTEILFVNPYKLAPGGVYGIANVFHWLFDWRISYVAIAFEVPLLIIAILLLGIKFGLKTILSIVVINLSVWILEHIYGYEPLIRDNIFISSICSGLLYGIAQGIIFKSNATSGGTDIVSMIGSKYTGISVGKMVLIVDACVTMLTLIISFKNGDFTLPIYSLILLFISAKVIDFVVYGKFFKLP